MIFKVVGSEDCVQGNNLPMWEPGGKAPSCWAILAIFQKKRSHFNAIWMTICTFLEQLEKATITKIGAWKRSLQPLGNSCNFSKIKAILTPFG